MRKAQRCIQNARSGGSGDTLFEKILSRFWTNLEDHVVEKWESGSPIPPLDTPPGKRSIKILYEFDVE